MESILKEKVINQSIGDKPMENAIADMLEKLDNGEIEKTKMEQTIALLKQLNNRHKNIIDAQRVQIKQMSFMIENNIENR